jgi:predicted AAA+ superfamily ATPase
MVLHSDLQKIIASQFESVNAPEHLVTRSLLNDIDPFIPFAIVLSGIRRCGKSTLLFQMLQKYQSINYLNFEDPRLVNFELSDFEKVEKIFYNEKQKSDIFFFDEIQNVDKWEMYIRSLIDRNKHVVITGSNSSLLSRELGSRLTGRHLRYELFPFNYHEFLQYTDKEPCAESITQYIQSGGFPEYIRIDRIQIQQQLLNDILNRDIAVRNNIRNVKQLNELIVFLLANTGKPFSLNSLQKNFQFGSLNTVKDFIAYFEDSYLIFTIPKFSYSLKKQSANPKKIYAIDTGMIKANTTRFSEDKGRLLENIVFLHLRRKYPSIFYFKEKKECDFVVFEKDKITQVIQVCYELSNENLKRETEGCIEAIQMFDQKEAIIITFDQEDSITKGDKKISVEPAWKWLLK